MRISVLACLLTTALLGFSDLRADADEPVEGLLAYLPPSVNGLAVVRVHELLQSPRAVREKWAADPARFLAGAGTVPHWVERFVMGGQVHPGQADGWTATVVHLPPDLSLKKIAAHEKVAMESLGGVAAAYLRDSYVLELNPQVLGVMTPPHRQDAARWARDTKSGAANRLSAYLQTRARQAGQIELALDMQDMLDPRVIKSRLEASPALRDHADARGPLEEALGTLRGVAFSANISDKTAARITFDFSAPLPPSATLLKEVFFEFLSDEQLMIGELRTCDARIAGRQLILSLALSDLGLRQIMSLVMAPHPGKPPAESGGEQEPPSEPPSATAEDAAKKRLNRNYYARVNGAMRDLQQSVKFSFGETRLAEQAGWVDRAIGKINQLSIQGIDPELAKYAANVSQKLQAVSDSLRGMAVSMNAAQSTFTVERTMVRPGAVVGGYGGGWRGYGGPWGGYRRGYGSGWGATVAPLYNTKTNLEEVRKKQADAVTSSVAERQKIWQSLASDHAQIRALMLDRYGEDFDAAQF